jgi:Pyrimidine dimer DNA glycosylase
MRMWMVDPVVLCRSHLLGEHVECHMLRGSLLKGTSLAGFVDAGLVDSRLLMRRHGDLAAEMRRRGYRHASPMPADFDRRAAPGRIDAAASLRELAKRCEECRRLQKLQRRRARGTAPHDDPGSPVP